MNIGLEEMTDGFTKMIYGIISSYIPIVKYSVMKKIHPG